MLSLGLNWTVVILILLALFAGLAMKLVGKWRQPDTVIGSNTSVLQAPAGNASNQVISVNGELKVSGQTTLQNLTVNGTSNLREDITAGGNLQVAKDANVVGQLTAGGLRVAGGSSFGGAVAAPSFQGGSFSGNGTGLTGVNAVTLGGQPGSFYQNASNITGGVLPIAHGGTGLTALPAAGQLLIGTGSGYTLGGLAQGSGISITNGAGSITIAVDSTVCTTSGNCGTGSGGGITGSGTAGTLAVFTGSGATLGNSLLSQSGGTVNVAGNLSATNALQGNSLSIGSGSFAVSGAGAITSASGITSSGPITFSSLGSGIVQSSAGGVVSSSTLDRNSALLTGQTSVANGGTGLTAVGSAGSIAYSDGSSFAFSGVGSSGQCLTSNAGGAPTWTDCAPASGGGNYIQNQNSSDQVANFRINGTGQANSFTAQTVTGNTVNATSAVVSPVLRPQSDGTTAFQVQNAAGTQTMLNVDTTNLAVSLANVATAQQLSVNDWRTGSTLSGKSEASWQSITSSADGTKLAAAVYKGKIYTLYNGPQLTVTGNGAYSGNLGVAGALQASAAVTDSLFVTGTTVLAGLTQVNLSADSGANLVCQNSANQLSVCDSSVQAPTAANFIQNQNTSAQTANIWINGSVRAGLLQSTSLDVGTLGGTLTIGAVNASTIVIGTAAGNVTFTPGGGLVANGTARHTKKISLAPSYAGAVYDSAGDTACASANTGTMSTGYDATNFKNYYQWTPSASAQCNDVVVRVALPTDFDGWDTTTPARLEGYLTGGGTIHLDIRDTANTAEASCAYVAATPSGTGSWQTTGSGCTLSGTYTAGGTITVRLRLTGNSGQTIRLGGLTLSYKSKF